MAEIPCLTASCCLPYERGTLYRQALRFAENRGLHISRVARTLVRDRLDWMLRQRQRLADLAQRFRVHGERLGLYQSLSTQIRTRAEPMVAGVTLFARSLADVVEERLLADPALAKQWEEMSTRFRYVFADAEAAFRAIDFNALLTNHKAAQYTLARLVSEPASIGPLKGRTGLLASKGDKEARRVAEVNVPALKRDIERYLQMRQVASERIEKEEQAHRHRLSIVIPALSPMARLVLETVREAIDRNDLPAGLAHIVDNREVRLEIDGFNRAIAQRFGERTLLGNAAREASGSLFDKAAEGLRAGEREKLRQAWPVMRAAQQIAAHERTTQALTQVEQLRLAQRQGLAWKL